MSKRSWPACGRISIGGITCNATLGPLPGAAALLGYLLIPKGRARAMLDPATVKQLAAELNLPEAKDGKQDILHKWVIPLALRWGTSGAMSVGQMLLAKMMAKTVAKEVVEEEQETSFIPPHRPR